MKVLAKILATSDYGYFDFWAGIEKWTYERTIDIARDAELKEYANDVEKDQGARIIRGIWNLFAENPRTEYAINREKLDALEEGMLKDILELNFVKIEKQFLLDHLQEKYPTQKADTIRRRIDNIVEKGRVDRIKEGATTFYALKAVDRLKRETITV